MQKGAKRGGRMVRGFRSGCMEPAPGAACEKQDEAAATMGSFMEQVR